MQVMYRLPVPCVLQKGESLPGLLSRATTENDYRSMSEIAEWFGIQCGGNHFGRADMRKLAIGAINIEQAARFTEHTTEQIRATNTRWPA